MLNLGWKCGCGNLALGLAMVLGAISIRSQDMRVVDFKQNELGDDVEGIARQLDGLLDNGIRRIDIALTGKLTRRVEIGFEGETTGQNGADDICFNSFVKASDACFLANVSEKTVSGAMARVVPKLPTIQEVKECKCSQDFESLLGMSHDLEGSNDLGWYSEDTKFHPKTWVRCVLDETKNEIRFLSILVIFSEREGEQVNSISGLIVSEATLKPICDPPKQEHDVPIKH